jgi:hypothetical protein
MTEFHEQAADIVETSSKYGKAFTIRQLRKCQSQVSQSRASLPLRNVKPTPGKDLRGGSGERPGHQSKGFQQAVSESIFDELFQTSAHPCYFHILSMA